MPARQRQDLRHLLAGEISTHRVRSDSRNWLIAHPRGEDRRLPAALTCCWCGRRIQKAQLKWAIIERLRIIRRLFPEDDFAPHAPRSQAAKEKSRRGARQAEEEARRTLIFIFSLDFTFQCTILNLLYKQAAARDPCHGGRSGRVR